MKLKYIEITGLFKKQNTIKYIFNDDLNIITGRNGSGKTTILKLAWLIISGNIRLAITEINFSSCKVVTDEYECQVIRVNKDDCKIELIINGERYSFEDDVDIDGDHLPFMDTAEEKAHPHLARLGNTLFFPTFRRIEGGFSLTSNEIYLSRSIKRAFSDFDEALTDLSKKLSTGNHLFVSAISSRDINNLLLRKYADYSERINEYQQEISAQVIKKISAFEDKNTHNSEIAASNLLSETKKEIEKIEDFRSSALKPLNAVKDLVEKLFKHSGISFGKRLRFGDAAGAVYSDELSAGEKQMLSFICYNAFYKDSIIFIDEPELSLHVDWQRSLYKILRNQNPSNQFIFATHSPFIYGKYPDKEVIINSDRGNTEEE